jgi:hypothetical protein
LARNGGQPADVVALAGNVSVAVHRDTVLRVTGGDERQLVRLAASAEPVEGSVWRSST